VSSIAAELNAERAEDRMGERLEVLVEQVEAPMGQVDPTSGPGRADSTGHADRSGYPDGARDSECSGLPAKGGVAADIGITGRAAHQAPETDGEVRLIGDPTGLVRGSLVQAVVVAADGVDVVAEIVPGSAR
jgi:hypothetical protein